MATPCRLPALLIAVAASLVGAACGGGDTSVTVETSVPVEASTPAETTEAAPPPADPPTASAEEVERRMERVVLELVNEERSERELETLQWSDRLAERARQWSRRMAEQNQLEHQEPRRLLERFAGLTGVGENIFRGSGPVTASTVHVGWMRSTEHRVNVLRDGFDRIGIGFVCADDGEVYATQIFGRTDPPTAGGIDQEVPPEQPVVAEEGRGPSCPTA